MSGFGFRGRSRRGRTASPSQAQDTLGESDSSSPEARNVEPAEGTVSAIEPQERRAGKRSNVYLDGRYAFSLTSELAVQELRVGDPITAARHTELVVKDQQARALDAALHFLGPRPRSEREIRDRLARGEYDVQVVDRVIGRLRELRLVDDTAFAAYWVEQRATHRPRGSRLLKQELRQKGVSQDVVAEALPEDDDPDGAYRAAQRKATSLRAFDERTFKQRLGGFLQRRGYDYETTRTVVSRLWTETSGRMDESRADE
jgi:regulatory protein